MSYGTTPVTQCPNDIVTQGFSLDNTEGIYETEYDGRKHLIAFRELKEDEIGKVSKAHKEHSLISKITEESLRIETNPVPSCEFIYKSPKGKFSQIEPIKGKEGLIFLFKLKINKLEKELAELNRRRDNSADLTERRELHKRIQKIEQIKLKEEGFKKKQEELERLDAKFEFSTEERLIAITHFRIT